MPVPFQDGALLNLCDHASFSRGQAATDDYGSDGDYGDPDCAVEESGLSTRDLIRKVIQLSLLDPIVDIRRDEALRSRLENSLLELVNIATLDTGQLKSFAEALMYPVHCTQGPPGTGKSNVGVVVVRALLVVRNRWKLKNRDVGDPPMLVLSYKNHAIDDFLLDLLRSEPSLGHTAKPIHSFGRYYLGNGFKRLVRIGGGCSEPELEPYRERNVAFSEPSVREVSKCIEDCQDLREQWHKVRDCFAPIFKVQTTVAGGTELLSQSDWKAVQAAVPAASSAVATLLKLASIIPMGDDTDSQMVDETKENVRGGTKTEDKDQNDEGGESDEVSSDQVKPAPFAVSPIAAVEFVLEKKPMLTMLDITRLYEGIKHYDLDVDPREVLYQWISGFRPLPACACTETCLHVCADKSKFCLEHSFVLQAQDELAHEAVEDPPRNTCERHVLCWGMDGMCPEVAKPGSSYCNSHAEDLYCKWVSKRGESCSDIATTGQYCGRHHAVFVAESARMAQKSTDKCQARTKKGNPCKGKLLSGSSSCRDHVGRCSCPTTNVSEHSLPKNGLNRDEKTQSVATHFLLDAFRRTVASVSRFVSREPPRGDDGVQAGAVFGALRSASQVHRCAHAVQRPAHANAKILMTTYGLSMMTKGRDPRPVPSCFVSTVDRFQGDEADIVIISLVIDGKSHTPFVKLQNRMIVLLSRARLGMYVVGNVDYFGETPHLQKMLGLLEKDVESDNAEADECTTYHGPRIGRALPICCSGHRTSVAMTKGEKDLKLGFCMVVCAVDLPCSHECGLMCHWPQVDRYNKNCSVEVESPCSRHPRVLKCSEAAPSASGLSIADALDDYECDIPVEVILPCGHNQNMKCHHHSEIEAQRVPWPVCNKEAIAPYVYSVCKHFLKCTCNEFDRYSKGLVPPCVEKVDYSPACQHTVTLSCHDRQDYTSEVRRFVCKEKVKISLPRCGHEMVVSCPIAEDLKDWAGQSCPMIDFVQEGESYGPKDYFCKRPVKFQRRCGHHEMVRCERAFELAQRSSSCQELVIVSNPECGHECSMTCFEEQRLSDKVAQSSGDPEDIDPLQVVNEGDHSNFRSYGLNVQCSQEVLYVRTCGHKTNMKCSKARHITSVW